MTIKVYLAAGFFDSYQLDAVDYIESTLDEDPRFEVFSPRRETKLKGFEKPEVQKKVFDLNVKNVKNSDLIICSTVNKDQGAIFEAAIAYDNDIPIIYTWFDSRSDKKDFNLMLSQSGIAHFTNKRDFYNFVKKLTKKNIKTSKVEYEGEFE